MPTRPRDCELPGDEGGLRAVFRPGRPEDDRGRSRADPASWRITFSTNSWSRRKWAMTTCRTLWQRLRPPTGKKNVCGTGRGRSAEPRHRGRWRNFHAGSGDDPRPWRRPLRVPADRQFKTWSAIGDGKPFLISCAAANELEEAKVRSARHSAPGGRPPPRKSSR